MRSACRRSTCGGAKRGHPLTRVTPPRGFEPSERTGPFVDLIGPLFVKEDDQGIVLVLWAREELLNARGFVHGGILATIADLVLGRNVVLRSGDVARAVTASLTIYFLSPVRPGEWIEASATVPRVGSRLGVAAALVTADGRPVAQASGVFAMGDGR
jgi:acyl-coenzyme A thioesterase 13